jgi:hypothetical protein
MPSLMVGKICTRPGTGYQAAAAGVVSKVDINNTDHERL